jgi:hypothetical protein
MSSGQPVYLVQESPSVSVRFIDLRLRVLVCFALRPNTNSTQKLLHRTVVVFSLLVAQLKVRVEDVSTLRLPCGHECCVGEAPTGHFLLRWCEEPELKAFATLRWGEPIQDLGAFGCAYCGGAGPPPRRGARARARACVCVCACARVCVCVPVCVHVNCCMPRTRWNHHSRLNVCKRSRVRAEHRA